LICVDASVAAKWVLTEAYTDEAIALAERCLDEGRLMIAPPLIEAEMANTLRQVMVKHLVSLSQATRLLRGFAMYPVSLRSGQRLYEDALRVADRFGLPSAYDAQYVALAEAHSCDMWTDDHRLLRQLNGRLPFVRWIGDYKAGDPL
jgi:predicted nucleic acid-binding protein